MELELLAKLGGLPRLSEERDSTKTCKVCGARAPIFDVADFNKHCSAAPYEYGLAGLQVVYHRCQECEFIFTDLIDNWTVEEVARFVYNDDYVKVDPDYVRARPEKDASIIARLLKGFEDLRLLDYGSGTGIFAGELQKMGFSSVFCYDPFSEPKRPTGKFDLITCIEVIEHSPRPLDTLADMARMLSEGGVILVGQTLQPENIEEIRGSWWYLAPRNGHVSAFSNLTFFQVAQSLGLSFHIGSWQFAFTRGKLSPAVDSLAPVIGPKHEVRRLYAPADKGNGQWHNIERAKFGEFRWTGKDELSFGAQAFTAANYEIQIPFVMQSRPDFASGCVIEINGAKAPTTVRGSKIIAKLNVSEPVSRIVTLRTPSPISPFELRGIPDHRPLGLAIVTSPG